jgi:hypothetical protein
MVEVTPFENKAPAPPDGASEASNDEFAALPSSRHLWNLFDYTRQRQQMACVTGDPGTSKTTTAKRYAAKYKDVVYIAGAPDARHMRPVLVAIAAAVLARVYDRESGMAYEPYRYLNHFHTLKNDIATSRPDEWPFLADCVEKLPLVPVTRL